MVKYCPNCGLPFVDSNKFCTGCGTERPAETRQEHATANPDQPKPHQCHQILWYHNHHRSFLLSYLRIQRLHHRSSMMCLGILNNL